MGHLRTSEEFDAFTARLDEITPVLREQAAAGERLGRLDDEVTAALRRTGAFRVGIPRELGGYEFAPRQLLEAIERVSHADASAGWVFMTLQMATGTTAAHLGAEAVRELFPGVEHDRHSLIAGQGTRLGTAVRVDGGHRISGYWQFASGFPLATHLHTAAHCPETGESLIFTFPVEQATAVDDWDVLGLRATASHAYTCEDLFVPDSRAFPMAGAPVHHGGAIFGLGLPNMAGICHTAWALGLGRRLLDEMRELAAQKSGAPGAGVDTGQFHAGYAVAEAKLRAARAWAEQVWADNERTLDRGELLSTEQETLVRLLLHQTTSSVQEIGRTVYEWGGTTALRDGALQRCFRDLHAGAQHVTSGPLVLQHCGRWLAGMAGEGARWVFVELQDRL